MSGSLEDLAYNKIKVAISKGYITKGTKLKEVSLSESLDMSRATVKGAVKRLVYEGLAEFSPNKGASVVDPSLKEIEESFQVRAQLEKMAASMAAAHLTSKDFDELQRLIQKEKDVFKAKELDRYYEINNAIHLKIAEQSGNRVLAHYIKELLQKTTIFLILFDPFYQMLGDSNTSPIEHQKIVQWLQENNGKQAGLAMEHHLESAMSGIDEDRLLPKDYLTV